MDSWVGGGTVEIGVTVSMVPGSRGGGTWLVSTVTGCDVGTLEYIQTIRCYESSGSSFLDTGFLTDVIHAIWDEKYYTE